MNKTHLALTSLTAAVPAGVLAFLIVSTFLSDSFDAMGGMLTILAGLTLAIGSVVALMPVGILVFGPKSDKPKKEKKESKPEVVQVKPEGTSGEIIVDPEAFSDEDIEITESAFDVDEIDEDEVVLADDDMFEDGSGEFEDFDIEVEEDEQQV